VAAGVAAKVREAQIFEECPVTREVARVEKPVGADDATVWALRNEETLSALDAVAAGVG